EGGDLLLLELGLRRHLRLIGVVDGFDEQTLVRLAGNDRRARIAATHEGSARVEAKSTALLLGAVTALAVFRQQRTHLLLEEVLGSAAGTALVSKRRTCGQTSEPASGKQSGKQTTKHVANLNEAGRRERPSAASRARKDNGILFGRDGIFNQIRSGAGREGR